MDSKLPQTEDSKATILLNMDQLIKTHISSIDRISDELTKHKDMLNDIFENDPTYKDHSEKAKEAGRIKAATKQQILKQPQAADLFNKIKSMQSELKELQGALSDYLQQYQQMSGVNEIEGEDGEVREIVYVAKLVKKSLLR